MDTPLLSLQAWSVKVLVKLFSGYGPECRLGEHELRDIGLSQWEDIEFLPGED